MYGKYTIHEQNKTPNSLSMCLCCVYALTPTFKGKVCEENGRCVQGSPLYLRVQRDRPWESSKHNPNALKIYSCFFRPAINQSSDSSACPGNYKLWYQSPTSVFVLKNIIHPWRSMLACIQERHKSHSPRVKGLETSCLNWEQRKRLENYHILSCQYINVNHTYCKTALLFFSS